MLTRVADDVFVHESEFIQSNTVIVRGPSGVLLIDPGITTVEMADLANDLRELGQPVVAGFSTHPHWDHVLWHAGFGDVPRFGTAGAAASMRGLLAKPDWKTLVSGVLPPEHADDIPTDLLGELTGLPVGAAQLPWDGAPIGIIEHRAHAAGHAALLIDEQGVLVAGDMLSDTLIPFLDLDAADPIGDYLEALRLFDAVAADVHVVIPGHGSVGSADRVRARVDLDRAYVLSVRDGGVIDDPRLGPSAPLDWLGDVHEWQVSRLAEKRRDAASAPGAP